MAEPTTAELQARARELLGRELSVAEVERYRFRLPVGLQIVASAFDEANVLRLAHAYEQATDWHRQRPKH